MIAITILSFIIGGTATTPKIGTFDIGGFLGYIILDTNDKDKSTISSLSIIGRLSYSMLDELSLYGFIGIATYSPFENTPTLTRFGIGGKYSLLSKEREVNFNLDAHFELLPFITKTKSFPNAFEWRITPNISFKGEHSFFFIGLGFKDFLIKEDENYTSSKRWDKKFFIAIGTDYFLNPETYVFAEMHSFGESAIFVGISRRF